MILTAVTLLEENANPTDQQIDKLMIGDEFFVRYVPQSMYFQPIELDVNGTYATKVI